MVKVEQSTISLINILEIGLNNLDDSIQNNADDLDYAIKMHCSGEGVPFISDLRALANTIEKQINGVC